MLRFPTNRRFLSSLLPNPLQSRLKIITEFHTSHRLNWRGFCPVRSLSVLNYRQMARVNALDLSSKERYFLNKSELRVKVVNKQGEKLAGVLSENGSKKLVIICHGFRDSKDHDIMVNISAELAKSGISSFRFDFAGNGESEGQFQFGNYWREADDLNSVVSHFKHDYDIIAIVGHSKGGNVVLLYASQYNEVNLVINISGRFDLKRGIKERLGEGFMDRLQNGTIQLEDEGGKFEVTKESLMDRLNTNMCDEVKKIKENCRVITIHGANDEVIPVQDAYEFNKVIKNHKLHIINGADHNYTYTSHQEELASAVVHFIASSQL